MPLRALEGLAGGEFGGAGVLEEVLRRPFGVSPFHTEAPPLFLPLKPASPPVFAPVFVSQKAERAAFLGSARRGQLEEALQAEGFEAYLSGWLGMFTGG